MTPDTKRDIHKAQAAIDAAIIAVEHAIAPLPDGPVHKRLAAAAVDLSHAKRAAIDAERALATIAPPKADGPGVA